MAIRGDDPESIRKALRGRLRDQDDAAAIELTAAQLRVLLDEIGRLQQSSDRLRRQNRRMRLRLQRAGLADAVDGEFPEGGAGGEQGGAPADPAVGPAAPAGDDAP